jgi:cell division protein FtsB
MHFLQRKRLEILVGTACIALLSYFIWQAELGPRGFNYQTSLLAQGVKLSADLDKLKLQRKLLEEKVAELRPDSIDPDLLDEMARQSLNFASPNQYLVHLSN